MKTYNIIYNNKNDLVVFCREKNISQESNILVQVFLGICTRENIVDVQQAVREVLPYAKMVGATTASEILDGKIISNTCILAISVFEKTQVSACLVSHEGLSHFNSGQRLARRLFTPDTRVLILFGDGLNTNGEDVIRGLDSVDQNVVLAGGLAGDNDRLIQTFVFTESEISDNGIVGAALHNPDLYVFTAYNFDWDSLSKPLKVTSAEHNHIYTIENVKAIDAFAKYLGADFAKGLPHTGQEYPLMALREGAIVSRPIIGRLDNGGVVVNANMRVGETVKFGYANFNTVLKSAKAMHQQLEEQAMESVFVYYCTARLGFFKSAGVSETLPNYLNVPVSGFFSYGEFSRMEERNQFVCQTMTIVVLSEDPKARGIRREERVGDMKNPLIRGNMALYNLIKVTSGELADANYDLVAVNEELNKMNQDLAYEIEERKAAEEQLSKANETLQQTLEQLEIAQENMIRTKKMAALGSLVTGMAHEINTPIGISLTASSHLEKMVDDFRKLIQRENGTDKEVEEYLTDFGYASQMIQSGLNKTAQLISTFKQVAVDQSSEARCVFKVGELLNEIVKSLPPKCKIMKHQIRVECDDRLEINSFPEVIYEIVSTLVLNSLSHAFNENMAGEIKITVQQIASELLLLYQDNGKGMEEEILERIFDPFFTTQRGKAAGLGLYIIYNLVTQKLGGTIVCSSELGQGSQFTVRIPIHTEITQ